MSKEKNENKNENEKTFNDLTDKSWFRDGDNIKIGESFQKIMSGESETINVKEFLVGKHYQTWRIVISQDDSIYLIKTSRELK